MADSPPDTYVIPDFTEMTNRELTEYRQEIVNAILNPGIEFESFDPALPGGETWYRALLVTIDQYLFTNRGLDNLGGGLP